MKVLRTSLLMLLLVTSFITCDEDVIDESLQEEYVASPLVKTLSGDVMGMKEESLSGNTFYSYYSIPFAQPPLGDLRFKKPEMVSNWTGVREISEYPPKCAQLDVFSSPHNAELFGDEDCLYLNIFTPAPNRELLYLPVMVFIHGGGFFMGSSSTYQPHVLMDRNIVFVTIQYRLGMLGFLSTEDSEAPGNLGLRDQTMALSWIQANIHMFGGDPVKITLFGESAGAASVHYQILSPRSIGLFQRAILQSGSALAPFASGGAYKEVAEYTGTLFNCTSQEGTMSLVSCLQNVPVKDLLLIQKRFNIWYVNPFLFAPRIDGDFLPADPEKLLKEARHKRLDLISGITSHEGGLYSIPVYANEAYRAALMLNFAEIGPISLELSDGDFAPLNQTVKIYDRYLGGVNIDVDSVENFTRMFSDRYFNIPHDLTSAIHAKNIQRYKKKVYRYEMTHRGQHSLNDMYGLPFSDNQVTHGDDLFYLFTGGTFKPLEKEEDQKFRDIIVSLWTNFATHGEPTPDDSLGFKWEPTSPDSLTHLNLNLSPSMEEDTRAETREFWSTLPLRQNLLLHPEKVANLTVVPMEQKQEGESATPENVEKESTTPENVEKDSAENKETNVNKEDNKKKDEL